MRVKEGDKVRPIGTIVGWDNRAGEIVAVVRESGIDGYKRKYWNEYIVQFKGPIEWGYFSKNELQMVTDDK